MKDEPTCRNRLVDPYQRAVTYLRVSVTDRCDMRCVYCMSEHMTFLPRKDLLTFHELNRICTAFVALGVQKIRITGGEPLVRRNVLTLFRTLARQLGGDGLTELTLTTNGSQLDRYAGSLYDLGVRRVNVSMDTLRRDRFRSITRTGDFDRVCAGIDAAQRAGLRVKINVVALRDVNEDEYDDFVRFCHGRGMDLTLIETMPMGDIAGDRTAHFLPLSVVEERLTRNWSLEDESTYRTGGPARYVRVRETGGRIGFISPLTRNFCDSCNRVRLTCTGMLYLCLGQEDRADLGRIVRESDDDARLRSAIVEAVDSKPKGHDFSEDRLSHPASPRHMSVTGG